LNLPEIRDFPYYEDSALLFSLMRKRPWSVFLDSGRPRCDQGRYDILSADPRTVLITRGQQTEIRRSGEIQLSPDDPFRLVQEALGPRLQGPDGIPFSGGAIGCFGYDLGRRLERLPDVAPDLVGLPEMMVGIYDWALVVDHLERRSWLVGTDAQRMHDTTESLKSRLSQMEKKEGGPAFRVLGEAESDMDQGRYLDSIRRIKHYIREGDCYQVNLARCFGVPAEGDTWQAYRLLRQLNAAPYGAYLNTPYCRVMSSSPERFLQVRNGVVETRPIKGTCPRGREPAEDRLFADKLANSPKDRAENLMIVDLLRNDLGKVCAVGSVNVPEMFKVEHFARVHHLVSTVRGSLAEGETAASLLRACFPGGSITGAPKLRAMEIIEELETQRRGLYCGAIGYLGFDGNMDTNIAIRTLVHADDRIRCWAGGGIVADSDPDAEYREIQDKAAPMLELLRRFQSVSPAEPGKRVK
jgi:para-aminobenzoate synthetase component I